MSSVPERVENARCRRVGQAVWSRAVGGFQVGGVLPFFASVRLLVALAHPVHPLSVGSCGLDRFAFASPNDLDMQVVQ